MTPQHCSTPNLVAAKDPLLHFLQYTQVSSLIQRLNLTVPAIPKAIHAEKLGRCRNKSIKAMDC
jgi:hypothetical protein